MLQEPMMEKLLAMRLHGMADALKTQEQDPAARELSFLERLGATGRSPVELASEPGAGAATARGQTARQRLRRRDRLPRGARTGQERDPRAGAGVGMGAQSRTHFRSRADRSCDIMSYLSKPLETLLAADYCFEFAGHEPAL